MKKYERMIKFIEKDIKNAKVLDKKESKLLKILSFFMFWNPSFMNSAATAIYPNIYIPNLEAQKSDHPNFLGTLAHEWLHLKHASHNVFLHFALYLMPQILGIFSLLSLLAFTGNLYWLFSLFFLIFLLPIPAYWRKEEEFEALCMTLAVEYWMKKEEPNYKYYIQFFSNSMYYWMWPFKDNMDERFKYFIEDLKNDKLSEDFKVIKKIIQMDN